MWEQTRQQRAEYGGGGRWKFSVFRGWQECSSLEIREGFQCRKWHLVILQWQEVQIEGKGIVISHENSKIRKKTACVGFCSCSIVCFGQNTGKDRLLLSIFSALAVNENPWKTLANPNVQAISQTNGIRNPNGETKTRAIFNARRWMLWAGKLKDLTRP
jgi:hypothetical protein